MGQLASFTSWCFRPEAFQKAILWSMLFEITGLGCGSGPLTGRYLPPIGGLLYFLRPGTTKLPVLEGAPLIGGHRRTALDVLLYASLLLLTFVALIAAHPPLAVLLAIAVLLPVLGLLDKTLFLAARSEHFWTTIVVFVLAASASPAASFVPGAKAIHAALWFWAGVSKLNHHFPSVVGVMTSNSPITRFGWIRRLMYRDFPRDLTPSSTAVLMGHAGTVLELAVPIVLLLGNGGTLTLVGLVMMLCLHGFITSNVPMGVPLEWNVMMVYGGCFLFGRHADVAVLACSPGVGAFLVVVLVVVPLVGNLAPARVSFLLAMRYYAGNWPYSVWLFSRPHDSHRKLAKLTKASGWVHDQLAAFYDEATTIGLVGKVIGFRLMHLHGRALRTLVPQAVSRFEDYQWLDGELVAGLALGWNFGDGHLHDERLLAAIQAQCGFTPGELRCIFVESQPLGRHTLRYRIVDAASGPIAAGEVDARALRLGQPWSPP
jgi:hypothetical protein